MLGTKGAAIGQDLRQLFESGSMVGLTDSQLVDRVAHRDCTSEAAFEALLTRHGPSVLACCRRVLGETAASEDAFQAVFLVLFRRAGSIRVGESLAPWLMHVARLTALKAREGELRRRARDHRSARPEAETDEVMAFDLRLLVHAEVDRLPANYRNAIRLCYFEGLTHDDAAAALGWPVGTVRGRLARARDMLRLRLIRRGVGITPVAICAAVAASGEARAEIPRALRDSTLAAASRGAGIKAGITTLAAAVAHSLVVHGRLKIAAVALLLVSFVAAGTGLVALARHDSTPSEPELFRGEAPSFAPAVDRFGDPLPEGAIARLGTARFRHNHHGGNWNRINRLVLAPDGRSLVTVGIDGETRVWDVASGHLIRAIDADLAALSADGKTLFTTKSAVNFGSDPKARLLRALDFASGRELRRLEVAPDERLRLLTVSPDRRTMAVVMEKGFVMNKPLHSAIVIYDVVTLAERRRIVGDYQHARDMAFSPDGRILALAGSEGAEPPGRLEPEVASVRLYVVATGTEVRRLSIEGFNVASVAFAPDGKTLAAGIGDRTVRLYDLATGRERLPRLGREGAVPPPQEGNHAIWGSNKENARAPACLAFSPDGSLLASGPGWVGDGCPADTPPITLWDVAAGREARQLAGHPWEITSLAFSPDGKLLASSGRESVARTWDVATGREVDHRAGHQMQIFGLAVSPADGTVFTAGDTDGIVLHWDPASGRALETTAIKPSQLDSLAISPDGRTLLIGDRLGPILWDVVARRELRRIASKGEFHAAFAPDGRTVASGLRVWDVASGRRIDSFRERTPVSEATSYTSDGRRLISVEEEGVRVWDFAAGVEVQRPIRAKRVRPANRILDRLGGCR